MVGAPHHFLWSRTKKVWTLIHAQPFPQDLKGIAVRPMWGSMYVYLDIAHHINLLKCLYYELWLLLDVARICQNEISNVAAHFSYGWFPNMLMVIINLKVGNDPDNLVDQTGQPPIFTCSPSLSSCMSLQFIISFM